MKTINEWLVDRERMEEIERSRPRGSNWNILDDGTIRVFQTQVNLSQSILYQTVNEAALCLTVSEAVTLAREILAACGETATLPPRGRKLADVQPCGCRIVGQGSMKRSRIMPCPTHNDNESPSLLCLVEDPNTLWECEPVPVSREAVVRECAEWLANDGRPILAGNMLAALLPGVKP